MKSMKVKPECINSVQVVQADGKVISICMDPTKQIDFSLCQNSKFGSCRVKNRQDGPMSIAVNLSPSNHVPVHAAFNTVADRKEANIIQRAKDKLAWKICYNPQRQNRLGQNVLVEMNGGTLQDRLGDPDSSTCLLQLHDKPSNRNRCSQPQDCCTVSTNSVQCGVPRTGMGMNVNLSDSESLIKCGTSRCVIPGLGFNLIIG
ncbi:unnamed protein product [Sphagnum jensenii]|uniref:Uncharacterized protein n=1 Tax=Sphagnum jensenii TaxID=128206 RepID=A0ABP1BK32_9BRYO